MKIETWPFYLKSIKEEVQVCKKASPDDAIVHATLDAIPAAPVGKSEIRC